MFSPFQFVSFQFSRRQSFRAVTLPTLTLMVSLFFAAGVHSQATPSDPSQNPNSYPDAGIVGEPPPVPKTPAELRDQAWSILSNAAAPDKHGETRIQALAALGTMGGTPRSLKLIHDATTDKDLDIRTAAVLAAGQTRSPAVTTDLRRLLDDKEPQVAFTAAMTLWKLHDYSGEEILIAVVGGDRAANASLVGGTEHSISRELHNPTAMAKDGALQGASLLLGPFGMGITAYEYIHKNGSDSARVQAIQAIAQNPTEPIRQTLLAALANKDLGVRAAAAKVLAPYHDPAISAQIARLFYDPKPPVRYTAAASYLVSTGAAQASPDPEAHQPIRKPR